MSMVSCPKCNKMARKGRYHVWQILIAICFFPIGLLALLADRKPSRCDQCGYTW